MQRKCRKEKDKKFCLDETKRKMARQHLAALRADMTFGEETESGYFDGYYDLDNSIVTEQAAVHGER